MTLLSRHIFALGLIAFILAACSSAGPELGNFPNLAKTEGDAPFTLTAPSSRGPGAFTYTSSNPAVATIAGNVVTVHIAGTTTITATQEAVGSFNSSTTTAVLTVNARVCTAPATRQNGLCVAPAATGNFVTHAGRTWMPVSFIDIWANASTYCATTTINGTNDWRLPTEFELIDLEAADAIAGQNWSVGKTWSSTAGSSSSSSATTSTTITSTTTTTDSTTTTTVASASGLRKAVNLDTGASSDELETNSAYVACVR